VHVSFYYGILQGALKSAKSLSKYSGRQFEIVQDRKKEKIHEALAHNFIRLRFWAFINELAGQGNLALVSYQAREMKEDFLTATPWPKGFANFFKLEADGEVVCMVSTLNFTGKDDLGWMRIFLRVMFGSGIRTQLKILMLSYLFNDLDVKGKRSLTLSIIMALFSMALTLPNQLQIVMKSRGGDACAMILGVLTTLLLLWFSCNLGFIFFVVNRSADPLGFLELSNWLLSGLNHFLEFIGFTSK